MGSVKKGSCHREREPVTFQTVRELSLALPEVEEGTSYGTLAFKVRGKLMARLKETVRRSWSRSISIRERS